MTGNKRKILYAGGFELPDKNAAAHRVLNLGKALNKLGHEVRYIHNGEATSLEDLNELSGKEKATGLLNKVLAVDLIAGIKRFKPDYVILYNYWSLPFIIALAYCRILGIKVISDCTEWYGVVGYNGFFKIAKLLDTELRMRILNKVCFRVISISTYLNNYYGQKRSVVIPPLIDGSDGKWRSNRIEGVIDEEKFNILYSGNVGHGKDKLSLLIKKIKEHNANAEIPVELVVAGTTEDEFKRSKYNELAEGYTDIVNFVGKLSHEDTIRLNKTCDVLFFYRPLVKSNQAGFPTKFVEAYTLGLPIVTNDVSDVSYYLKSFDKGVLVESMDELELDDVINKYADFNRELDYTFHYERYASLLDELFC